MEEKNPTIKTTYGQQAGTGNIALHLQQVAEGGLH
jgi:hypothetical protein